MKKWRQISAGPFGRSATVDASRRELVSGVIRTRLDNAHQSLLAVKAVTFAARGPIWSRMPELHISTASGSIARSGHQFFQHVHADIGGLLKRASPCTCPTVRTAPTLQRSPRILIPPPSRPLQCGEHIALETLHPLDAAPSAPAEHQQRMSHPGVLIRSQDLSNLLCTAL